jgi:threonine/homoserine/homoserine lactone efflux protein
VIALVGLAFLFESIPVRLALGLFGAGFMLYLAGSAVQEAREGGLPQARAVTGRGDFMTGAALSLGNPFQVVFWLGIGATTIAALTPHPGGEHYAAFMIGFFLAGLLWCFIFAYIVSVGRRFVRPRTFQAIELVCAVFLTYLGITLLWSTLQSAGLA